VNTGGSLAAVVGFTRRTIVFGVLARGVVRLRGGHHSVRGVVRMT
jgi:hypothetical protein